MKQVNVRLLLLLLGVLVGGIVGTFFLHRFQVARNAGSLEKLARAKLAEGKTDEAMMLLGRYIRFRRDDADALAEYANLLLARVNGPRATRNDFAAAFGVLEEAVRKNPEDHALRRGLADFLVRIGRYGDAREHLGTLREFCTPTSPPPLDRAEIDLAIARCWAGLGNYDEAAGLVAELIGFDLETRSFPDDPPAPRRPRGDESAGEGKENRDDEDRKPADTKPTDGTAARKATEAYVLLAAIFDEKRSDTETAKKILERLVETNAGDYLAWLAFAKWSRQHGDLEAASRAVAKAAALAPDDPETMLSSFEIAISERKLDRAAAVVKAATEKFPDDERVVRAAAILAVQSGEIGRGIDILETAGKKGQPRPALLLMLADLLLQQSRLEEVDVTIATLKELIGGSNPAVGLLEARTMMGRQQWLPARQKLDRVRPMVMASSELTRQVDLYLGQCHERLGEFDEQLVANRRVLSDDPNSLAARVGAAGALLASGKTDQAMSEFEEVAAAIPAGRLPSVPQVWGPLMQLRISAEMRKNETDRDWTRVDDLMAMLERSEQVSDEQVAIIRADLLVRKGEVKEAAALLAKATKANPKSVSLQSALATIRLRQGETDSAMKVIDKAPENVRNDPGLILVEAQVVARQAQADPDTVQAAMDRIEKIAERGRALGSKDDSARVLGGLASLVYGLGRREAAERFWNEALELRPDDLRIRMVLLDMAREEGSVEKMRSVSSAIVKLAGPTTAIGRFAEATSRVLEVRRAMRDKTASAGDDGGLLGRSEVANLREARNLLIEAENERPGWADVQQLFAEIDGLEGDIPAAIDRLQRAVRLGSANPAVVRQLVSLLYASNRFDEARDVLGTIGPDGLGGFEKVSAELQLRGGKVDEAVAVAERAVATDSRNASELLWLGQLLSRSGKAERAEEVLTRAVERSKDRPESWLSLIGHQIATGQKQRAARTLEKAGESLEGTARHLVLAQGNEMLGRFDEAERQLLEAVEDRKDDLEAIRALASFSMRRGKLGDAKRLLSQIVDRPDDDPAARATRIWARRLLAELTADRGSYATLQKAIKLLEQNSGPDGQLGPEDQAIAIRLLSARPEPDSWRRALALIGSLAKTQPLSIGQRLGMAQLREKLGLWEDCRSELMSLVTMPDAPVPIYAMLVEQLIDHDETSSARNWLEQLRQRAPDAAATVALEAKLAMAEKDRPTAVAAARKLMPTGPVSQDELPQLQATAKLMEDLGFPKAADKVLAEFAGMSAEGIVARVEFLARQKRPDEALTLLEDSWNKLPLERVVQVAVVVARTQGSSMEPAIRTRVEKMLSRGKRQDPGSLTIALLEAELKEILGETEAVEPMYRTLLARPGLDPSQRAIVANNLAFHLARKETAGEALELIESAIRELGPHPDLLDTRGVVQVELGNYSKAVEDLKEASLAASPVKLLHLAVAQEGAAQIDGARRSLAQARKLGLIVEELTGADKARLRRLDAALGNDPAAQPVIIRDRARASSAS